MAYTTWQEMYGNGCLTPMLLILIPLFLLLTQDQGIVYFAVALWQIACPLFEHQIVIGMMLRLFGTALSASDARRMRLHNKPSAAGTSSLRLFIHAPAITGISSHVLPSRLLPARFF